MLDRIGNDSFSLISVEFDDKQVADVLPRPGEPIGGRLLVTGRLLAPEAPVKLNYGFGKTVLHTETFTLRQADAVETGLVPRFWRSSASRGCRCSRTATRKSCCGSARSS